MSDDTLAVDVLEDVFLSNAQLAELIGVDASTFRRWRTAEPPEGLPFISISGRVTKYCRSDVRRWIAQRRVSRHGLADGQACRDSRWSRILHRHRVGYGKPTESAYPGALDALVDVLHVSLDG